MLMKQQIPKTVYTRPTNTFQGMDQADKDGITAMFKQQEEQWKVAQDQMET
jgi:hypothetical protein